MSSQSSSAAAEGAGDTRGPTAAASARVEAARARTDTARVAQMEVDPETSKERSTSRCSSCRTGCSQVLRATCSPQTCACRGCSRLKRHGSIHTPRVKHTAVRGGEGDGGGGEVGGGKHPRSRPVLTRSSASHGTSASIPPPPLPLLHRHHFHPRHPRAATTATAAAALGATIAALRGCLEAAL